MHTKKRIFVFEFKLDKSAKAALDQIYQKDYLAKFSLFQKPITAIGISFSSATKGIGEFLIEELGD